jgi:hypothetical protein
MIMNYEREYKDALERAKHEYQTHKSFNGFREMLIYIFPGLKEESKNEKIRKNIKVALMSVGEELADFYCTHHTSQEELISWLDKQGDYKPNWSEEDESIVESILFWLKSVLNKSSYPRYEHWLNSLKPQNHWKPTEEQLTSLTIACDRNDKIGFDLTELLKDLKKL